MAIDEAMFRLAGRSAMPPTLRFYGWSNPSVSLGHFQHVENEIDLAYCRREGIDVVFRPTGGKAVYHDDDLTYAVISGEKEGLFPPDVMGTYQVISNCLISGLCGLDISARCADDGRADDPDRIRASCFSAPSRFELLVDGRKICGSAQVRSRQAFLQHGSLLMTFDPVKTYEIMLPHREPRDVQIKRLQESVTSLRDHLLLGADLRQRLCVALQEAFAEHFQTVFREGDLTAAEEDMKHELLQTKYRCGITGHKGQGMRS